MLQSTSTSIQPILSSAEFWHLIHAHCGSFDVWLTKASRCYRRTGPEKRRLFIYGDMSVFTKLLKMAMISRISAPAPARIPALLHDLRHTWATLALSSGEHPKVVQERLGHAAIAITLDVYSHVTEGLHGDAAPRVAGLIFGTGVSTPLANAAGGDDE